MTSHNRVLLLLGGAAIIVSLSIAVVFAQTDGAAAKLQADQDAALSLQTLGDEVVADVQEEREALDEYLMAAQPAALVRYRQAVTEEIASASQIHLASDASGVTAALTAVATENAAWRSSVAEPAIAAVQSGSPAAIKAAIEATINERDNTEAATTQFVLKIDLAAATANLNLRSDALDRLRVAATAFGLGVELLVAGLALWFVRRYGSKVSEDGRRRAEASAERIEIVASLRSLRMESSPEATAAVIAEALNRLPGVDVGAVFEFTSDGLLALAIAGLPGLPIKTGDLLPERHARHLRDRSTAGPWAERWTRAVEPSVSDELYAALGMKSRAFAPIQAGGEVIGLIGLATTNESHARHLVEDLPAVAEFASVADAILAPALVARSSRAAKRLRVGAMISTAAFRPVFQPVVDLATGRTVGYEALTRFDDGTRPDLTFAAALACGMGLDLETATLLAALREADQLPAGAWLSLNVSPALLAQNGTLLGMLAHTTRPVVLEVTEHEAIEAYAPLREAMLRLGPGVRLAVDDVGAGVANFNHLVELRPDFVKIDIGLVRGVDADPSRRAVVVGLTHFAAEAGCQVIAEGIETLAERATVAELGVTLGQGYLLAKPAAAEVWTSPVERPVPAAPSLPRIARSKRPNSGSTQPTMAAATLRIH